MNSRATNGHEPPPLKTIARDGAVTGISGGEESLVTFQMSDGLEIRGAPARLTRRAVKFEMPNPATGLRASEVLNGFKIVHGGRTIFSGRATISGLTHSGSRTVCEAKLDEQNGCAEINVSSNGGVNFLDIYRAFFAQWQHKAKLLPEFKMAVFDLHSYLSDLKLLMEQIEISLAGHSPKNRAEIESQLFRDLVPPILSSIDVMHERFEEAAGKIHPESRGDYQALVHRRLHPLFLCAPFGQRTYHKPLGYAGDYEIMNMIHRNTFEGESLYAKIVHYWLVNQWAAKSVRNRVAYLKTALVNETVRVSEKKRVARILNLGCGPAREIQEFICEHRLANDTEFTLVDFDAETIDYVASKLAEMNRRHDCRAQIQTRQMSVAQLIKYQPLQKSAAGFDLIYCGGLFDYLTDQTCRQLVGLFYDWLVPGGRIIAANMNNEHKPFHQMVEHLLDWHLIYRNASDMSSFVPEKAAADDWLIVSEPLAVNLFLEIRKLEKS